MNLPTPPCLSLKNSCTHSKTSPARLQARLLVAHCLVRAPRSEQRGQEVGSEVGILDGGIQVPLVDQVLHSLTHLQLGIVPVDLLHHLVDVHALAGRSCSAAL